MEDASSPFGDDREDEVANIEHVQHRAENSMKVKPPSRAVTNATNGIVKLFPARFRMTLDFNHD